jgi:hypothetical protein
MNFQDTSGLAQAILSCKQVPVRKIKECLPESIASAVPYAHSDRGTAMALVSTCDQYPVGLETLIDCVRAWERETSAMAALDLRATSLLGLFLGLDELWKLHRLLRESGIERTEMEQLYARVSPAQTPPAIPDGWDPTPWLIHSLARLGVRTDGGAPLLEFVDALLQQLPPSDELRAPLSDWMSAATREQPESRPGRAGRPLQPVAGRGSPLYLMIELDGSSAEGYVIRAWSHRDDEQTCLQTPDRVLSVTEVEGILPSLIGSVRPLVNAARGNFTIEFFLPLNSLCLPVDEWIAEDDETLGFQYSVTIRLRERFRSEAHWGEWLSQWLLLRSAVHVRDENVVWAELDDGPLWRKLAVSLRTEGKSCLAVHFDPANLRDGWVRLMERVLRAGTPIAVWPRQVRCDPADIRGDVETRIVGQAIHDIPVQIRQHRRDTWALNVPQQKFHLCLLLDDPTRLPEGRSALEGTGYA